MAESRGMASAPERADDVGTDTCQMALLTLHLGLDVSPSSHPVHHQANKFEGKFFHTLDGGNTWTLESIRGLCVIWVFVFAVGRVPAVFIQGVLLRSAVCNHAARTHLIVRERKRQASCAITMDALERRGCHFVSHPH